MSIVPDDDAAWLAALDWRPMSEYPKGEAPDVMLRAADQCDFGSWAKGLWRSARPDDDYYPLMFEPTEFAYLSPDQQAMQRAA